MVLEHQSSYKTQCATTAAIAPKIGCIHQTLPVWLRKAAKDVGTAGGSVSEKTVSNQAARMKNRELRQANEIPRKASAYFALAELDRPLEQ
ncbi:hypothetical protein ACOI1H_21710 [Loktanella sp. DJP18]|uniref:hypothetical protein n=1 Tax=Loktanella sp. DJP18 TaxID=3409788 RepID=UPI003BB6BEFB